MHSESPKVDCTCSCRMENLSCPQDPGRIQGGRVMIEGSLNRTGLDGERAVMEVES